MIYLFLIQYTFDKHFTLISLQFFLTADNNFEIFFRMEFHDCLRSQI